MNFTININFGHGDWQVSPRESHTFLQNIRSAVLNYRKTSASSFSIPIEVAQAQSQHTDRSEKLHVDFNLWVGFYNFSNKPIFAACRPKSRKRRGVRLFTEEIEVHMKKLDTYIPLERFLEKMFPTFTRIPVGDEVMFQWWKTNGKVFNWLNLPNELKERIVCFCMHRSRPHTLSKGKINGAPEVTGQFGQWAALLGVSHQVRTLCLRMCFVGSSDLQYGKGLCIDVKGHRAFKDCMRRLGKCFQMLEPGHIPTNETCQLAEAYNAFPRIYPHLYRYATLRHAIRKINLQMSFLDFMHFFGVTTGSFTQYFQYFRLNYEIFEQLPCLNKIRIQLPDARGYLADRPFQPGPQLFYGEPFNCPRTLHRLIYERAAEALATYENVTMYGFIDTLEEALFYKLREEAKARLKFTLKELDELYRDGGGIELEESVIPGIQNKIEENPEHTIIIQDAFWPPKCRCEVRCRHVLHPDTI